MARPSPRAGSSCGDKFNPENKFGMNLKWSGILARTDAARIAATQARLIGSLQHPLVVGDDARAAAALRALAPSYDELLAVLLHSVAC